MKHKTMSPPNHEKLSHDAFSDKASVKPQVQTKCVIGKHHEVQPDYCLKHNFVSKIIILKNKMDKTKVCTLEPILFLLLLYH